MEISVFYLITYNQEYWAEYRSVIEYMTSICEVLTPKKENVSDSYFCIQNRNNQIFTNTVMTMTEKIRTHT
jgi:hypothetical protein